MKRAVCVTAAICIAVCSLMLGGCTNFFFGSGFGTVEFSRSSITLSVGDSFDLSNIINSSSEYVLTSSNPEVASLRGNVLTANEVGRTTVTAETALYIDSISVFVHEREPNSIELTYSGDLIQTLGDTSVIEFNAQPRGDVVGENITWYVNDHIEAINVTGLFTFTPSAVGEYEVCAKIGDLKDSLTVRVYYEVSSKLETNGQTYQTTQPYTPIEYTAVIDKNPLNPPDYIEWFLDGEAVALGQTYTYDPAAGRHTVTAHVNGKLCGTSDVGCIGSVTPQAPTLEFDNLYPHAYLKYDAVGQAAIEITSTTGGVATYMQTSAAYSELFDENGFDVGSLISLCASGTSRRSYRFRVKSLGDGDLITESEYSPYYSFMQLPVSAKPYLESRYCDRDMYITSDWEYVNLLEYEVVGRPKTGKTSRVSFDCYIAYELSDSAEALWNDAFEIAATSGSYSSIDVTMSNNVLHTSFVVSTFNTPTRQTYGSVSSSSYASELHAILPHINYDPDKYRPDDYVFPIDKLENTAAVSYTDELYFAAQNNTRPVPAEGSAAKTVYNAARDVLRKICTDDMTDVQKAHAIYDWIMWTVTYDDAAADINSNSEAYSAYYLEGVFGDGSTPINGVAYAPYAVCDGISKAYSLLCNIEGIPCVRVAGEAGYSMQDSGGHAWNKVFVNGAWYVVDCTWGDSQARLTLNGVPRYYELGLHDYLFLSDFVADVTHYEPYEMGYSSIVYAPETPYSGINVYENMIYNGVEIDCYIRSNEILLTRVKDIATAFAKAYAKRTEVYVPGGMNGGRYTVSYEALDIKIGGIYLESDAEIANAVSVAVRSVNPRLTSYTYVYNDIIVIMLEG